MSLIYKAFALLDILLFNLMKISVKLLNYVFVDIETSPQLIKMVV